MQHPLLACYLPLGDPGLPADLALIYAECGVDIFELGIPTDNPWMDGPIVSSSMQRTLAAGVNQAWIGEQLSLLRKQFAMQALVVMGYENLNLADLSPGGKPSFDGLLRAGPDNGGDMSEKVDLRGVALIPFVSSAMLPDEVANAIKASGYVMLQAADGKTGLRTALEPDNRDKVTALRRMGIRIPILLGFGISTPKHVAEVIAAGADGVIIGSACLCHAQAGTDSLRQFLTEVRSAMNACCA